MPLTNRVWAPHFFCWTDYYGPFHEFRVILSVAAVWKSSVYGQEGRQCIFFECFVAEITDDGCLSSGISIWLDNVHDVVGNT